MQRVEDKNKKKYGLLGLPLILFLVFGRNAIPWSILGVESGIILLIAAINIAVIIANILKSMSKTRDVKFSVKNLLYTFTLLILYTIAFIVSNAGSYSVYKLQTFLLWVFIPTVAISFMWKNQNSNQCLFSFILVGIFTSINILLYSSYSFSNRLVYGNVNPIWIARMLGLSSLICIIKFIINNKSNKIYLLFATVFIVEIIFTGSRGPLLSMIIAILFYILSSKQYFSKKIIKLVLMGLLLLIVIISFVPLDIINARFTNLDLENQSFQARISFMRLGIEAFADKPLLGQGLGGYSMYAFHTDERVYPHNLIVETLSEFGLLGFIMLIIGACTFVTSLKTIRKSNENYILLIFVSIFVYYFTNSMFSGDFTGNIEVFISFAILINIKSKLSSGNTDYSIARNEV